MGTMRNNFMAVFVLLVLMLSTSQSLPHGHKNSPKRNSLEDDFTRDARSNTYPIYNCLFVDPNLPICDMERMLNSDHETIDPLYESPSGLRFDRNVVRRSRRNADVSAMERVVVYTIEGCIPSSIPFSLPSCDGISLDKIVDVQRFRPFAVKGVTQSPLVFPEFNYDTWLRMMTRLQNRISSNKQDEQGNEPNFPKEISVEDSPQDRKDKLMNVATTTQTMSNVMSTSNEPSQSRDTKTLERNESRESSASSSLENVNNNSKMSSANANEEESSSGNIESEKSVEKMAETTNDGHENEWKRGDDHDLAIPSIPSVSTTLERSNGFLSTEGSFYEHEAMDDPGNRLATAGNSRSFFYLHGGDAYNEIGSEFDDLSSIGARNFRRRREARLSGNDLLQGIADEPKTRGIAGKSVSQRMRDNGDANGLNDERKSHDVQTEQRGIALVKDLSTTATPERGSKTDNSRLKSYLASRKAAWRRALLKDAALGKKHRSYMELPTSISQ